MRIQEGDRLISVTELHIGKIGDQALPLQILAGQWRGSFEPVCIAAIGHIGRFSIAHDGILGKEDGRSMMLICVDSEA